MEKVKTIAVNVAVAAVIAIVLLWGNTLYRQYVQYEKGEQATKAGDFPAAVAGYDSAIHMYTPLSPLTGKSAEKLWFIGESLERSGDVARALVAYRALRSSFYAIRWVYQPGQEWIDRCDARINALLKAKG